MTVGKVSTVILVCALLTVFPSAACQTTTPTSTGVPTEGAQDMDPLSWGERDLFRANLVSSEQDILAEFPQATEYHIELTIPEGFELLRGKEAVRYTNQEDNSLDEVYFRLYPNVVGGSSVISNLTVDGEEVQTRLEAANSSLRVELPVSLEPGESIVIELDFDLEIPREMGGNYGLFGYFDNVLVLDTFYPMIPVYDDDGWSADVPQVNGDFTYNDAAFYIVQVHSPADLVVVASGVRVHRSVVGNRQTTIYANGPARDFYLAASKDFTVVSKKVGETIINSYALSGMSAGANEALKVSENALRIFNERLGSYPYSEMDLMSTPMRALGIEYPGAMGISLGLYDLDRVIGDLPAQVYLESTVAHEVAHQWFYNLVGNDQPYEPWLDEAPAQYFTGLYYQDLYNNEAADRYRTSWQARWDRVDGEDIPIGLPAGEYGGDEYGAIVYGRGPIFLSELASTMGTDVFDEFIKKYVQSNAWEIGTADEFEQLAELTCECDLRSLFETWVYP